MGVESVTDATDAPNEQVYDKCNWHHQVTLFYNSCNVTTEITLVVDSISGSGNVWLIIMGSLMTGVLKLTQWQLNQYLD